MKRQGPHNAPRIASGVREGPGSVSSSYFRITLGSAAWPFPSLPTCRRARRAQNPAGPADRIQAPSLREGKSEPQLELSMAGSRNCRGEAENPVMMPQNRWVPSGSAAASGRGPQSRWLHPDSVQEGGSRPIPSSPWRGRPFREKSSETQKMPGPVSLSLWLPLP